MNSEKILFRQTAADTRSSSHDALIEESDNCYDGLNRFAALLRGETFTSVSTSLSLHDARKFKEGIK